MLLAVAGPARGRSHTSRTGSESKDVYGYFDHRSYLANNNYSGGAFDSIFDDCDMTTYSDQELSAIHYIPLILFPFLLLQGIVGNILAIPALINVSRSAWSTVIYLACLAGTDLIILLIRCGDAWYYEAAKVSLSRRIIDSSDAACKTYYFAFACVKHVNPWLLVATAVEMMIATRWPKQTYIMCTLERARNVIMLTGIIIVCLDINHFWTIGVPKPGFPCIYTEEFSENFKDWIWPVLDNTVDVIMPLTIVSICFFVTGMTMIQRPAVQERDIQVQMKKYFLELNTLRDFRTICFVLCLLFMCLNTFKITYTATTFVSTVGYLDLDCLLLRTFKTVDMALTFFFYGAKIYLYIGFSSMFRARLKEGFAAARLKLSICCRKLCSCGRQWTPAASKDNRQRTMTLQGQQMSSLMHGDETEYKRRSESGLVREVNTDVQKPSHSINSFSEAQDSAAQSRRSQEKLNCADVSELTDARPLQRVKGSKQTDVTGTKV